MDWKQKLCSRKFWLSVAALLSSVATSIAGLASANETVTSVGTICAIISAAIYAASEAYVDGQTTKAASAAGREGGGAAEELSGE